MMRHATGLKLSASMLALVGSIGVAHAQAADAGQVQAQAATQTDQSGDANATPAGQASGDVVVTGIRRSLAKAADIKKNSDEIVDSIVAEDIGKFPDINAIEAVARVPGVQIGRRNDEGFQTLVRGLTQVTTTLNGRESFTINSRTFALQEFSSDALAGVDVFKANTAVNLEAGLGGLINVRLRRAFDLPEGLTVAGGARAQYYDLTKKVDPLANGLVSYRWHSGIGELGILANIAYAGTKGYNQSVRYDGTFNTSIFPTATTYRSDGSVLVPGQVVNGVVTGAATTNTSSGAVVPANNAFNLPTDMGIFLARGRRFRPSATLSFQWAPDNDTMIYLEGFYQGLRADIRDSQFVNLNVRNDLNNVHPVISNAVISTANGPTGYPYLQSASVTYDPAVYGANQPYWLAQGRRIELNTIQGAFGGTKTMGDVKLSADIAYTDSWQLDWQRNFEQTAVPAFTLNFATNGPNYGAVESVNFDTSNIANWQTRRITENYTQYRSASWQGRFDGVLATHGSFITEIDFGFRGSAHINYLYGGARDTGVGAAGALNGVAVTGLPGYSAFTFALPFRGTLPGINPIATLNTDALNQSWGDYLNLIRQRAATSTAYAGVATAFAPDLPRFDPLRDVRFREHVVSSYIQAKALVDVGFPIDGIAGVRIIDTDTVVTASANVTTSGVTTLTRSAGGRSYVDFLPNVSVRARFTPKLQLRLSYAHSLFRPDFGALSPAVAYSQTPVAGYIIASSGNPNLNPTRSHNYDVSLEYYFSRAGYVTAGLFKKNITGLFFSQQVQYNGGYPGVTCDPAAGCQGVKVTQVQNAAAADIKGAEAAFNTFLTFLPKPLDGFGIGGNVTYLDAKQQQPLSGAIGAAQSALFQIQNLSKWTYNLFGYYEKGPASIRLSYNYRSDFLNNANVAGVSTFIPQYTKAISRLDASGSLRINRWVSLTADATNLLGTPFIDYNTNETYPVDTRYESRTYSVGVRFRF